MPDVAPVELRRDVVAAVLSDDPRPVSVIRAELAADRRTRWHETTVRAHLRVLAHRGRAARVHGGWVRAERTLLDL